MFTGLIEAVGKISAIRQLGAGPKGKRRLVIDAPTISSELAIGDSISISGVCLTAVEVGPKSFAVEAVGDSLLKTTFGKIGVGAAVNLERALRAGDRLDGHIVQGHVNGMGTVLRWTRAGEGRFLHLRLPAEAAAAVVPEGSIAVDGVSLTIAAVDNYSDTPRGHGGVDIRLSIIPHTFAKTNFDGLRPGALVNIETDVLLRQFAALRRPAETASRLSMEKLVAWGYK